MEQIFRMLGIILWMWCPIIHITNVYGNNLKQLSNTDGLSNNAVLSLYQDYDGLLWLGTCDGLNLYDGLNIRPFTLSEGKNLSGNIIENILETDRGTLWIQTNYGLDKINKYTRSITSYTQFQGGYLLKKSPKNDIFILSERNILYYILHDTEEFRQLSIPQIDQNDILNVYIDERHLWVFTSKGIVKHRLKDDNKQHYTIDESRLVENTPLKYVFLKDTTIYFIDQQNTLYKYHTDTERKEYIITLKKEISERGIISDIIEHKGTFFISFQTNGVLKVTLQGQNGAYRTEDLGIQSGIFRLLNDRNQDIVWIATDGQGIYLCTNERYSLQSITYNELNLRTAKPVRSVYLDEEHTLWLGTKGEGILRIRDFIPFQHTQDYHTELITTHNSLLNDNSVYAFAESKRPLFWIGSDAGINYYSYVTKRIEKVPTEEPIQYVHAIYEEGDSVLWIATVGTGIIRARIHGTPSQPRLTDITRYTIDNGNFSSNYFFTLTCDKEGVLWFGNRGYGVFKMENGRLSAHSLKNHYADKTANDIFSIIKEDSILWLGTSYGFIRQTSREEQCFNKKDGFQNSTIHTLLQDNSGNVWMSTNGGLVRFHTQRQSIQNYNQHNGLKVIEYSDGASFKKEDALFFGGINGLVIVRENPAYSVSEEYTPPVSFTRLSILGQEQNRYDYIRQDKEGNSRLELDYTQNYFSISFFAMDYINSNNYSYLYKIENEKDKWIDNGLSNTVSFTQLSPGNYTLQVKYKNKISGKESPVYTMHIYICPPWYLSNAAIGFYSFLVMVGILLLIRTGVRKQKRKHIRMVRKLEQAHKEEVYEEKLRFFTNITHEFCTPLTLMYGPCERILAYANTDTYIRKYVTLIKQNAERLNSLIQEVIDFRRMETGHKSRKVECIAISNLCNDIVASFSDLAEQNSIHLENRIAADVQWNTDYSCFTKIANNLISNAFKYTRTGGTIRITLDIVEKQLQLSVFNTGEGIKKENMPLVFNRYCILDNMEENAVKGLSSRNGLGMAICHSMVELLEGRIAIQSEVNQYAEFIVTLPELPLSEMEGTIRADECQTETGNTPVLTNRISITEQLPQPSVTSDKQREKILVIDDNVEILMLIQDSLSDNYQVITAENGEKGLELLTKEEPALIVTDIMMPGTDGIELTRQIKKNRHTMHIPLIMLSARNTSEEKIEGLQSGADAYIEKPFNIGYLKAVIARMIENKNIIREYYHSSACAYEFTNGQLMQKEDKDFLQSITEFIANNMDNTDLSPEDLAAHMQISVRNLYRKFKELEQLSPKDFIKDYRISFAAQLLCTTNLTVQEIMYRCGFGNRSHFYKEFDKKFHETPKEYRNQHRQKDESFDGKDNMSPV